jgi:pyruvate/2-oxoglutarate dehydrogenase complex dihydrolipoamide dehydrogenase (E3) component
MPSKTLIESGNRYRTLRHAEEFGLHAEKIGFDAAKIVERKRRLIGEFADYRASNLRVVPLISSGVARSSSIRIA